MKKHNRSILTELAESLGAENKDIVLENRAGHIIQSAINLLEQVSKNYSPEQAEELEKKFYSSIKNRDGRRFERSIKKIHESK